MNLQYENENMKSQLIILNSDFFEKYGLPNAATKGSAAFDVRATESATISPNTSFKFKLGFKLWIKNPTLCAKIYSRSGLSINKGGSVANGVGLIDSDYQGEWVVTIRNCCEKPLVVESGDRIAQFKIEKVINFDYDVVDEFTSETDRAEGGHGHTGK